MQSSLPRRSKRAIPPPDADRSGHPLRARTSTPDGGVRGIEPLDFEHPTGPPARPLVLPGGDDRALPHPRPLLRLRIRSPRGLLPATVSPAPDGNGYVLACPPTFEATIYMTARAADEHLRRGRRRSTARSRVRAMEPPPIGPRPHGLPLLADVARASPRASRADASSISRTARTSFRWRTLRSQRDFILDDEAPGRG